MSSSAFRIRHTHTHTHTRNSFDRHISFCGAGVGVAGHANDAVDANVSSFVSSELWSRILLWATETVRKTKQNYCWSSEYSNKLHLFAFAFFARRFNSIVALEFGRIRSRCKKETNRFSALSTSFSFGRIRKTIGPNNALLHWKTKEKETKENSMKSRVCEWTWSSAILLYLLRLRCYLFLVSWYKRCGRERERERKKARVE